MAVSGIYLKPVRIVVDLIVDTQSLGSEACLMVSEWGYNNLYVPPKEWCSAKGMECYGHDWKTSGVYQWGSTDAMKATGELPEE